MFLDHKTIIIDFKIALGGNFYSFDNILVMAHTNIKVKYFCLQRYAQFFGFNSEANSSRITTKNIPMWTNFHLWMLKNMCLSLFGILFYLLAINFHFYYHNNLSWWKKNATSILEGNIATSCPTVFPKLRSMPKGNCIFLSSIFLCVVLKYNWHTVHCTCLKYMVC